MDCWHDGTPAWGLDIGLTTFPHKNFCLRELEADFSET
jgi:hypothetical protein